MVFLENDDPWHSCLVLECALEGLLQKGLLSGREMAEELLEKSSFVYFAGKNQRELEDTEVDGRIGGNCPLRGNKPRQQSTHLREHNIGISLMHRLCLDVYVALASVYRVLAVSVGTSDSMEGGTSEMHVPGQKVMFQDHRLGLDVMLTNGGCYGASAAYRVVLAFAVEHFFQAGDYGLIASAAQFWVDAGEALLKWTKGWDNQLPALTGQTSEEIQFKENETFCGENSLIPFSESECRILAKQENSFIGNGYAKTFRGVFQENIFEIQSSSDFLNYFLEQMEFIWPILKMSSPFLRAIANLSDLSRVHLEVSAHTGIAHDETGLNDLGHNFQVCACAVKCAHSCLHYAKHLMKICYGLEHPLTVAVEDLLHLSSGYYV
eukprot:c28061_g5_i1 orf=1360-2496(+)